MDSADNSVKGEGVNSERSERAERGGRADDSARRADAPPADDGQGAHAARRVKQSNRLPLEVGARLMIRLGWESEKQTPETPAFLIGYSHYEFLILKPQPFPGISSYIMPGTAVSARFLHDGSVYIFKADVISNVSKPSLMLFVSYPYSQSTVPVRRHKRFRCAMLVLAVSGEYNMRAIIDDLSMGGCRLVVSVDEPGVRKLQKDDEFMLQMVLLPENGMSTISAVIRSVEREQYRVLLGVSFTGLDPETKASFEKFFDIADSIL